MSVVIGTGMTVGGTTREAATEAGILARAALGSGDEPLARHEIALADALYREGDYVVPPALRPAHEELRRAVRARR